MDHDIDLCLSNWLRPLIRKYGLEHDVYLLSVILFNRVKDVVRCNVIKPYGRCIFTNIRYLHNTYVNISDEFRTHYKCYFAMCFCIASKWIYDAPFTIKQVQHYLIPYPNTSFHNIRYHTNYLIHVELLCMKIIDWNIIPFVNMCYDIYDFNMTILLNTHYLHDRYDEYDNRDKRILPTLSNCQLCIITYPYPKQIVVMTLCKLYNKFVDKSNKKYIMKFIPIIINYALYT